MSMENITDYVFIPQNIIAKVTRLPSVFNDEEKAFLISLIEKHPFKISKLSLEIDVERFDTFDNWGRPILHYIDKVGAFQFFYFNWLDEYLIDRKSDKPKLIINDTTTMDVLFFEPDLTMTKVIKAWYLTDAYPNNTGKIIGKRNLKTINKPKKLKIRLDGEIEYRKETIELAQKFLNEMNKPEKIL